MNWFTHLFACKDPLIGQRVHAWHWTQWGKERIEGEVISVTERELVLDRSTCGDYRAFVSVWRHDARPLDQELPVDLSPNDP